MKDAKDTGHCTFCQKEVTYHVNTVNHSKELLRTVFSFGLWLPVWLFMATSKAKICDLCGNALPTE